MRISKEIADYFKEETPKLGYNADVYLFGSRTDDKKRGGDIDILIIADKKFDDNETSKLYWGFQQKFGEQKLDIACFAKDEESNFKNLILSEAIKL